MKLDKVFKLKYIINKKKNVPRELDLQRNRTIVTGFVEEKEDSCDLEKDQFQKGGAERVSRGRRRESFFLDFGAERV